MKKLMLFAAVIELCLGAAMIHTGHASNRGQISTEANHATSAPFRDGLYLGKLAAERGGESHISVGRWASEADRASFAAGFNQGYQNELLTVASKGSTN
jgi:hypothetical protein